MRCRDEVPGRIIAAFPHGREPEQVMIEPGQRSYFETFGFIHLPGQFSSDEMETLTREADRLWKMDRGGGPFAGRTGSIQEFVEKSPVLTRFVVDDRIWGTVEDLLGPRFLWNGSEGNQTSHGEHRWHTDRPGEPHATTYSFHLYLDPVREDTGCLRVIPGSHRPPLYSSLSSIQAREADSTLTTYGLTGTAMPYHALESDPGDIVFFNQKIYHGVYGGRPGRRFIKLRFVKRPRTSEQIASLMRYNHRNRIYRADDAFLKSEHPRIRAMVDPLLELEEHTRGWI